MCLLEQVVEGHHILDIAGIGAGLEAEGGYQRREEGMADPGLGQEGRLPVAQPQLLLPAQSVLVVAVL